MSKTRELIEAYTPPPATAKVETVVAGLQLKPVDKHRMIFQLHEWRRRHGHVGKCDPVEAALKVTLRGFGWEPGDEGDRALYQWLLTWGTTDRGPLPKVSSVKDE